MASRGNRHCASCIGTLSFPIQLEFGLKFCRYPNPLCVDPWSPFDRLRSVRLFSMKLVRSIY